MDNKGQQYESNNSLVRNNKRMVIIHRHLFKNAGTTFDAILENNFGRIFCDHRYDEHATMRNFHTRHLTGIITVKTLKKKHFKKARKEVLSSYFIGLVDFFDQSLPTC